jgi:6-pyruvoyltetrahydropterin/6-carboxytetrahydropterin synthase
MARTRIVKQPTTIWRRYETEFSMAHIIKGHPKCGREHGHNYTLLVSVKGDSNKFVDFYNIEEEIEKVVSRDYDHRFVGHKTCEELAREFHRKLTAAFKAEVDIELWETSKFSVRYPV